MKRFFYVVRQFGSAAGDLFIIDVDTIHAMYVHIYVLPGIHYDLWKIKFSIANYA